ncbi:MAG: dienelactone hydrolase family protein [Chloroflexi bacterium]|nr:dienelactone hydrolase family protein [Chloroflexota bacterium]
MIVKAETVFTDASGTGPRGYLVRPDDAANYPGIVLIQEWRGIEPHIRDLAQKLAAQGYIVLVPDLYHGQIATEPDDALKLMMLVRSNIDRALGEIQMALEYLRNDARVQPKNLGLMGFCMGGLLTYKMASRYPHLAAVSPWYGAGYDPKQEDLSKVSAPLLAVYGELDKGIPPEQIHQIEKSFAEAGKQITVKVYSGAGHAFLNNTHGAYHEASAKDAWQMAPDFFKRNLV